MSDYTKNLFGCEHFGLHVEFILELVVIDPCVACCEDQDTAIILFERECLCNPCAFNTERKRCKLDRCT